MDEHRAHDEEADEPPAAVPVPPPPWAAWTAPGAPPSMPPGMPPPPVPPYRSGAPYGVAPPYGWSWGPAPQARRGVGRAVAALTVASGVLVAAALGGIVGHEIWRAESSSSGGIGLLPTPQATNPNTNTGGPQDAAAIAGHVDPGLVDVNTEIDAQGVEGAGTGMVLTSSGEVLTNNHVVEGANRISVTDVGNGHTYAAEVVGYDRSHDIAVLQLVGASGLQTVTLGNSSRLNVGQAVVAIGNANGSGGTPSYAGGTITALDQTITASDQADGSSEQLQGLVETDADVVSGDSGGPLVDGAGRVIGMDTAASGAYRFDINGTQGFAIPISEAVGVARQIEAGSSSATIHIGPTALLGVEVRGSGAAFGGLGGSAASGAAVVGVIDSGPAARMGIVAGDVITSVGGHVVTSAQSLTNVMLGEHPGATVAVQYLDTAGQEQTVQVKLASGPPQ